MRMQETIATRLKQLGWTVLAGSGSCQAQRHTRRNTADLQQHSQMRQ
ncbi:MAG: hypothetical protein HC769_33100 [Cyanobacteria bacterium CRU_2_1]|nr:hypothetical protein [Cyanobacteria bacterium CRU_2_1]